MINNKEWNNNKDSDFVEKVKERNDIVDFMKERIRGLKTVGNNLVGFCVFHNDRNTPNLTVFPETQSFHCFRCKAGGDVITFVMEEENLDFHHAVRFLAERKNIPFSLNGELSNTEEAKVRAAEPALREAAVLYHQNLPVEVRDYLKKERGLTDETIDENLIGYCGGKTLFQTSREKLIEASLCYESGKEFFEGFITFPHFHNGRIVYLSGRGYPEKAHKKLVKEKVPLIHAYRGRVPKKGVPVLVEGEIDALTLWQNGFNAYSIGGVECSKDEWASYFRKLEMVYLAFDSDDAGREASQEIGDQIGQKSRIVSLPDGEDINDYFKHASPSDFKELQYKALHPIEYKIGHIPATLPTNLPQILEPILREIATFDMAFGDAVLEHCVKKHFRMNKKDIHTYERLLKCYRKEHERDLETRHYTKEELCEILRFGSESQAIDPSQDLKDGVMYFTVFIKGKPYLLTSNGELIAFSEAKDRGILLSHERVDTALFSHLGISAFLEEGKRVNALELFRNIRQYIRRFIFFEDDAYYDFLSLWVMGTYVFKIFQYYPYLWVNAEKGSGKTLLMQVLSNIAFNGNGDYVKYHVMNSHSLNGIPNKRLDEYVREAYVKFYKGKNGGIRNENLLSLQT